MDEINRNPGMTRFVVSQGLLGDPVTLIDVGCSGGIHDHWRVFGEHLRAFGFDPQRQECARLNAQETTTHVRYFPYFVGLESGHDFHQQRRHQSAALARYFGMSFSDLSAGLALECSSTVREQNNPLHEDLTTDRVRLDQFVRAHSIRDVDFIKIDTDGGDLEVLLSAEEVISGGSVLGFMVESPFTGTDRDTDNSFHNIDRLLRRHGYCLFSLSVNRYSRRALPTPFKLNIAAQTETGQAFWGDAVYFRNAGSADCESLYGQLGLDKLLKLACLYEIFNLNDCAAEVIQRHQSRFAGRTDPEHLLDLLTPPLHGVCYPHHSYLRLFHEDVARFFPGWSGAAPPPRRRTLASMMRGLVRRAKAALAS